jgi:hypothetical protein
MNGKFTVFFLILLGLVTQTKAHPYFLSVTEVHIQPEEKTFNISCSMFTEDLESAIKSIYLTHSNLQKDLEAQQVLDLIYQYISARLEISFGEKKQSYTLVGCENQEESTWCYLEGSFSNFSSPISVSNALLFDFLEEQTNMVHMYVGEVRQSVKLNNPNKNAVFTF